MCISDGGGGMYVVEVPLPYIFDDVMCVFFDRKQGQTVEKQTMTLFTTC